MIVCRHEDESEDSKFTVIFENGEVVDEEDLVLIISEGYHYVKGEQLC